MIESKATTAAAHPNNVAHIVAIAGRQWNIHIVSQTTVGPFKMVDMEAHCDDAPHAIGFSLEEKFTVQDCIAEIRSAIKEWEV